MSSVKNEAIKWSISFYVNYACIEIDEPEAMDTFSFYDIQLHAPEEHIRPVLAKQSKSIKVAKGQGRLFPEEADALQHTLDKCGDRVRTFVSAVATRLSEQRNQST